MASVTLSGAQLVVIVFDNDVSGARAAVETCGRELQARIASEFERVSTYAGPLAQNSPAYNVQKALNGYDLRRGHRTGALQSAINSQRLFTVSGSGKRWRIQFSDRPILSAVSHARYYIPQKVQGGKIAGVRRDWLKGCKSRLDALDKGATPAPAQLLQPRRSLRPSTGLLDRLVRFVTG